MLLLVSGTLFVLGAVIASFIGVIAGRFNTEEGFLAGRSRCDVCNEPLHPFVLVPILSYIFLRGRALCCGARLSFLAPVTEVLLGALFVGAYLTLGLIPALPLFLFALSTLLALVVYDLAHQILPPAILTTFVIVAAISGFVLAPSLTAFLFSCVRAVCIGGSLALIHLLSRGRAMGLADAPLAFGLSLLVGPAALSGFVFSFWIGAVIGIALLYKRPSGSRMGTEVPFAPFLAAGFLLAYFTQWNPFALTLIAAFH